METNPSPWIPTLDLFQLDSKKIQLTFCWKIFFSVEPTIGLVKNNIFCLFVTELIFKAFALTIPSPVQFLTKLTTKYEKWKE